MMTTNTTMMTKMVPTTGYTVQRCTLYWTTMKIKKMTTITTMMTKMMTTME